jgi:hypothetical protein
MTGCRLDGRGSISGSGKGVSFLHSFQTPIQWVPVAISPGLKWWGCEAYHSPPSSAEVKNRLLGVVLN